MIEREKKMQALKGKIWIIPEEINIQNDFYKEIVLGDNANTGIREFVSKYQLGLEVGDNSFVSSYLLASCGYLVVLEDLIEKDTSIYIPASVSPRQLNFINENKLELMKSKVCPFFSKMSLLLFIALAPLIKKARAAAGTVNAAVGGYLFSVSRFALIPQKFSFDSRRKVAPRQHFISFSFAAKVKFRVNF